MPFAQMVALATLGGWLFTKERYPLPWCREVWLLCALWVTFLLSTTFAAIYPLDAWPQFDKVSKILLITFVTLLLIQDQHKLRALLMVIALSLGFFGLKGGVFAVLSGGNYMVLGPPDTFLEGNTNLGLALNMTLPLLFFLGREEHRPWLRRLLLATFWFSIIAVLITYSRGALLGLLVVLSLLFLKSKTKFVVLLLLTVTIPLAAMIIPEKWFGRMETVQTYEEDRSAMGRIRAWEVAYRLALDRPLLGGGFEPFSRETYLRYLSEDRLTNADIGTGAHNIFLQILAEHGFTGLFFFAGLILSTMYSIRQLVRRCRTDPAKQWICSYAQMVEASLMGYVASGLFLSMCYFDLFYHLVAVVIILKKLSLTEEKSVASLSSPIGFRRVKPRPRVVAEAS